MCRIVSSGACGATGATSTSQPKARVLRPSPSDNHLPVTLSAFLSSGLARVAISVTASVAVMACAADDPVAAFGAALPCTLESRDLGIVLGTDTTATAPLVAPRLLR